MAPSRFNKDKKAREVTPFREDPNNPAPPPPARPITPHPDRQPSPAATDMANERPVTPAPPPEWSSYDAPMNFTWVIPEELCGMGWPKSRDQVRFLVEQGIDHLVTLSPEKIPPHYAFPNLKHTLIPVEDFTGPTIAEIQKFIEITDDARKEGEAVGVHCAEGRGRTGVMCACYLIYYYDMEPWDAIRIMRRQRPGSVERKVQEETVVKFYTLLQDYGKSSLEKLEEREKQLMFEQKRQQAELIRNEGLMAQQATMNLLHHMHSFHAKQSSEAKKERITRMRRTKSVPKMEDEEAMNSAVLKSHLQSFLQGEKSHKKRSRSQARGKTDEEDASDSDRRSRCTTPGRSLLEEVSLKPVSVRTIEPAKPEETCELKNHFRDFMRTPATVKRGRSFSQPRDKEGGAASGAGDSLSRNGSFEHKSLDKAEQERRELANHTKRFLKRKSMISTNKMSDNDSDNDLVHSASNSGSNSSSSACRKISGKDAAHGQAAKTDEGHSGRSDGDNSSSREGTGSGSSSDNDNGEESAYEGPKGPLSGLDGGSISSSHVLEDTSVVVTSKPPPFKTVAEATIVVTSSYVTDPPGRHKGGADVGQTAAADANISGGGSLPGSQSRGDQKDLSHWKKAYDYRPKYRSKSDVTTPTEMLMSSSSADAVDSVDERSSLSNSNGQDSWKTTVTDTEAIEEASSPITPPPVNQMSALSLKENSEVSKAEEASFQEADAGGNKDIKSRVRRNNLNSTANEYIYISTAGNKNYNSRPRPFKSFVVSSTSEDEDELNGEEQQQRRSSGGWRRRRSSASNNKGLAEPGHNGRDRGASAPGLEAGPGEEANARTSASVRGQQKNRTGVGYLDNNDISGNGYATAEDLAQHLDYGRRAFSPPPAPTAASQPAATAAGGSSTATTADIVNACKSGFRRLTYRKTYSRSGRLTDPSDKDKNNNPQSGETSLSTTPGISRRKHSAPGSMYTQHSSGSRLPSRPTTPGPYLTPYDRSSITTGSSAASLYSRPVTPGPFTRDSWKRTNQKFNYAKLLSFTSRETYV